MIPALSFVVPMYNAAETIGSLVRDLEQLAVAGGHEIVLVNDGGTDNTMEVCAGLVKGVRVPLTVIEHSRNFGEHNAVLTGWRHARGAHIVNLDDDGQNPPREALRLWQHAIATGADVVFGHYEIKQHSPWRNAGSWLTTRVTDLALDKPAGF
jgi:undecaprenyl-phosphate 4-deoxy-4-formamido-L-arabinose transferase